jgi:ATP-dependent Clp protease ATP-binding subunit ClpA
LIDEAEYIHSSTLLVLQQFLDNSVDYVLKSDGTKVFKNKAAIGLISDFGTEGLAENSSLEELQEMVYNQTLHLWNIDPRQAQLIQFIIPFVSLSDEDIINIVKFHVEDVLPKVQFKNKVERIEITEKATKFIVKAIRKQFPKENGRAVDKWIKNNLVPKLSSAIKRVPSDVTVEVDMYNLQLTFSLSFPNKEL